MTAAVFSVWIKIFLRLCVLKLRILCGRIGFADVRRRVRRIAGMDLRSSHGKFFSPSESQGDNMAQICPVCSAVIENEVCPRCGFVAAVRGQQNGYYQQGNTDYARYYGGSYPNQNGDPNYNQNYNQAYGQPQPQQSQPQYDQQGQYAQPQQGGMNGELLFTSAGADYAQHTNPYLQGASNNSYNTYNAQGQPYNQGYNQPYGQPYPQQGQYYNTNIYVNNAPYYEDLSSRNRIAALIMCFFGGVIGLHRFYTGKIGTGILYLFTGGLFGIGWLIDLITIASGSYRDDHGRLLS